MELLLAVFMGACLAASSGFRAFLPLFGLGLVYRMHAEWGLPLGPFLPSTPLLPWITSDAAILCFGVATAFEILADKVPGFDHGLHALLGLVRPATGSISVFALLNGHDPLVAYTTALVVGTGASLPVVALKAAGRAAANAVSLGAAAPVLSVAEDLGGATLLLVVLAPLIALFTGLACLAAYKWWRRTHPRTVKLASQVP